MNTLSITSNNIPFTVRVVNSGDNYGLDNCLTHEKAEPLVEFYDKRYPHTEHGQFISRYNLSSIMSKNEGINLHGGVPDWNVDTKTMREVRDWLKMQHTDTISLKLKF